MKRYLEFLIVILLIGPMLWLDASGQNAKNKLTSNNYLVEVDLHKSYLTGELDELKESKSKLMKKMKAGNKKTELQLKELSATEKSISGEIAVLGTSRVSRSLPPPPPPRPCPVPRNCMPIPPGSNYLVVDSKVKSLTFNIYSDQGKLLASGSGKPTTVAGAKGKTLKAIAFDLKKYNGPVQIKVKKTDSMNKTSAYAVAGYIQ